jgi:hypothetical protein
MAYKFSQGFVNKPCATKEVLDPPCQNNLLLDSRPLDLIHNSLINA